MAVVQQRACQRFGVYRLGYIFHCLNCERAFGRIFQRRRLRLPLFRFLEGLVLLYFFFEERDFLAVAVCFVVDVEVLDLSLIHI